MIQTFSSSFLISSFEFVAAHSWNPYLLLFAFIVAFIGSCFAIIVVAFCWWQCFFAKDQKNRGNWWLTIKLTLIWAFVIGSWWTVVLWRDIFK